MNLNALLRRSRLASFGIALVLASSAVACGGADDEGAVTSDEAELVKDRSLAYAGLVFHVPSDWRITEDGDRAFLGAGSDDASRNFVVRRNFTGTVEELAPKGCTPYQMEAGFKRVGELTAEYRKLSVDCAGTKSQHSAWLLPSSKVGIYEQRVATENEEILVAVDAPLVGFTKDFRFDRLTFHMPEAWTSVWTGDLDGSNGTDAWLGGRWGGPALTNLHVIVKYQGDLEGLTPTDCLRPVDDSVPVTAKKLLVDGFAPMGGLTARFRKWSVTCADGVTETHSAWLLPVSKIAVYEDVYAPENADVVANLSITK